MTFREYIRDIYNIEDKLIKIAKDPYTAVLENDDLPYDEIRIVDGVLQKVVELSEGRFVSVMDLLSFESEDVEKMHDEEFKRAYFAYMDNVDVSSLALQQIMSSVRQVKEHKQNKKELLSKCTE